MATAHWTEDLFLRHPEVFLAVHEHAWSTGEEQARDLHAIFGRFGVPADGRILDAPCGIGRHATRLAKIGYKTVGIDLSPTFVARAIELANREGVAGRATFRVGDLRRLLVRGGWHPTDAFGGFKMDAPSIDSPTQIVIGRR